MKISTMLFTGVFLIMASACSTFNGSAAHQADTVDNSRIVSTQIKQDLPADYIQVLDELVANGCAISSFEMVERSKALDMKVACK